MKYFSSIFVFILFLCGCSQNPQHSIDDWMVNNGKIKVLSTTAMIGDLVKKIGGDRIDSMILILGEVDPHSYQLVKGDDEKLSQAQIVFYNGLGLEHGASLRYRLQKHAKGVALGDEIQREQPELILYVDGQKDPHIWMDISLWSQAIDPITAALSDIDPAGKESYEKNAELLHQNMQTAHIELYNSLQQVPESKRYLVTSHDAFNYFTRAYLAEPSEIINGTWKKRFEAPEGLAPDNQLSSFDIQRIIDYLCFYHIQVVFPESNVSRDSLKKIVLAGKSKGLNIKIASGPLYGDSVGSAQSEAGTYLGMMKWDGQMMIKEWE